MNQQQTAVVWRSDLTFQPNEIVFRNGKFYRNSATTTITEIPPPDSPWVLLGVSNGNGNTNANLEQVPVSAGSPGNIGTALVDIEQRNQDLVGLQTQVLGLSVGTIGFAVLSLIFGGIIVYLLFFRERKPKIDTLDTEKKLHDGLLGGL